MSRILAIDDSPSALRAIETFLADAGHRVVTCASGRSAVQMLRHEAFDLILTDIYMPEEDGIEVIQESRHICPNVPPVAMSGVTGEREMLGIAKLLGACRTIEKPFSEAALRETVEAALREGPISLRQKGKPRE